MKINKALLVITSLIILLPIAAGLVLWNSLPDMIATHFGINNEPNGWSSKAFTVFVIPGIMFVLHLVCLFVTANDPKGERIGEKSKAIVYWLLPVISVFVMGMVYANALNVSVDVGFWVCLLLGLVFVILGNYMPKARQNYTFGIKTPWTFNSEENWNRSNRVGGWAMVIAGIMMFICAFTKSFILLLSIVIVAALVPLAYSYYLYKKGI